MINTLEAPPPFSGGGVRECPPSRTQVQRASALATYPAPTLFPLVP